ncbi:hypothetical protein BU008_13000 [Mammaliicoccus sciuri]|nr:hypothetical protein BU008_13000 [Mammaliicoccus sciuri]
MFGALCPSPHAISRIARFKNKQIINKTAYSTVIEVLVTESLNKLYKISKIKVSAYVIVKKKLIGKSVSFLIHYYLNFFNIAYYGLGG